MGYKISLWGVQASGKSWLLATLVNHKLIVGEQAIIVKEGLLYLSNTWTQILNTWEKICNIGNDIKKKEELLAEVSKPTMEEKEITIEIHPDRLGCTGKGKVELKVLDIRGEKYQAMHKDVISAIKDSNIVIILIDPTRKKEKTSEEKEKNKIITVADQVNLVVNIISRIKKSKIRGVIFVFSKMDMCARSKSELRKKLVSSMGALRAYFSSNNIRWTVVFTSVLGGEDPNEPEPRGFMRLLKEIAIMCKYSCPRELFEEDD